MGEGVPEGIRSSGKSRVSYRNSAAWRWVRGRRNAASGTSAMAWNTGNGTSVPTTAAVWRSRFSSGGNRSIRAVSTACTVAGICRRPGLAETIGPRPPDQHPGLGQRAHAFLQEERLPSCGRSAAA